MKQSKKSFRHESLQDAKTIQELLKSVARGFARGELVFSDDEDEIIMQPEGLMNLKVTSNQEENRHRINIRITWQIKEDDKKQNRTLSVK
ncbi:MAG TPA: amphi-Trp domain-containing protein [Gammaproteobacteria bacterium]|nr:amphi-Trp domain-containing protein [Gammaproteobacteria bacterium]